MFIKTIVLCAIFAGVISGPAGTRGTSKCVAFCKEPTKFGYEPGTSYNYDYATDISTSVIGGSNHESRIHLTADVEIHVASSCELILNLQNVAIQESTSGDINNLVATEGSQSLINELELNPLRFSFQDGKVEHICAPEEEPAWVLNIKRGILSTLQNTMEKSQEQTSYEVDVGGRCLTKYSLSEESWTGTNTITKVKELSKCSQRHSHISALQSIPYTSQSLMENLPLLKSSQECTQFIRDGKVDNVQCKESHRFQPFQQEDSGAQTTVSQTLTFSSEERKSWPNDEGLRFKKMSLLFQSQGPSDSSETDVLHIVAKLQRMEQDRIPDVRAEAPQHFMELVESLKTINAQAMRSLFSRMSSPVARKYLLDAMPLVSSAPSLSLMRDLLLDGTLTEKQIDIWLSSLIFIKHPNLDMIAALQPLLGERPRLEALFGISAMLHSYCQEHDECTDEVPIQESLEKIFSYLGPTCEVPDDPSYQRRVLHALKAIGNAGRFPSEADQKSLLVLNRCFMEKRNPVEIRLAAIDAFRRIPCDSYDEQPIMSIYSNIQHEDTELRIKSYLIAMKCATRPIIDQIKDILYTDSVNQVSSFVWTHLTNMQESSNPDKQAIRELLANEFLQNKFKTDARKYSRNYEGTYFNEDWNVGVSSDANIIFTPDSFLPRSGMVNLTVHMFGNAVNILEIGARVKAIEQILEPIFGPNGYYPDQAVIEALHSMRAKRDLRNNEIERLSHIYNQASVQSNSPCGSVYTRVFGHEIMYKNFELANEDNDPTLVDENGRDWLDMNTLMSSLTKGEDIEYTKSTVLLDATYTVSTCAGIPLSLAVQSAATIGVTASGKMDIERFWQHRELDVEGLLRPSASIEVDGILSAQLGRASSHIKSGIRLQNTLHTSTAVQGNIKIQGSKLIRTSISLPQDKQEIFTAKSQLLILRPSGKPHTIEQGPEGVPKIAYKSCKGSTIFGVEFCAEVDVPENIIFPLSTPAVVSVYMQKTDTFESYEFDYKFSNENSETSFSMNFDTPGSQINRRLAANFGLDLNNGQLEASVHTPSNTFSVDGKYSATEKSIQLRVTSRDDEVLLFNTGLNQHGNRYEPNLFIKLYNRPLLHLEGNVDLLNMGTQNGRATIDLSLKHLTQTPIHLTGDINRSGEKFDTKIGVESYILTGNVRSQFRFKPGHVSSKAVAEYSWRNAESRTVDVSAKLQNTKKGSLSKFIAQFNLAIPDSPDMNVDFMLDSQRSPGFFEKTLKMSLGKTVWEGHALYNNQFARDHQDLTLQISLNSPRLGVDYNAEFLHKMNADGMSTKFSGRTRPENEVKAELDFVTEDTELLRKTLTAKVIWPENEFSLRAQLKELHEGNFEGELIILPQNSEEMKAAITYKNGSSSTKLDHSFEFRARGFTSAPISGNAAFSASDKQSHLGGQIDINNKRWSTSLDYGTVKKNNHKLEGKLTLDEKKYTGEINYRLAKNGDRILTADFHSHKHVALEAKLNGDFPGPFTTSVFIFPNKDTSPEEKLGLQGTFDARAINVKIYYYDDIITASGSYGNSKLQAALEYGDSQRYQLSVDAPEFDLRKTLVTVKIGTPILEYQNIELILDHSLNNWILDSKFQAKIEANELVAVVSGSHSNQESRLLVQFDMSGIQSLKGYGRLVRKPSEKSLELTYARGENEGNLVAEFIRNHSRLSSKFMFKCCEMMPEILIELHHHVEAQITSFLKTEWVLPGSERRRLTAEINGEVNPLEVNFVLKTPWENFERLETGIKLQLEGNERILVITLNGEFDIMPLGLTLRCHRNGDHYKYEIVNAWNDQDQERVTSISVEGHFITITEAAIKATVVVPQHVYQVQWIAERDDNNQKIELGVEYDQQRYTGGYSWNYIPSVNHVKALVWIERHNQPKLSLEFERLNTETAYKLYITATKGETILLKTSTDLTSQGFLQWEFVSVLESSLEMVPTLRISSDHVYQPAGDIRHKSTITLGRTNGLLQKSSSRGFGKDESIQAVAEFNLVAGRDITGELRVNNENIRVTGVRTPTSHGNKLQLQLESTRFEPVGGIVEYRVLPNGYSASLETSANGNAMFVLKAEGKHDGEEITGELEFDCSFGHHVKGNVLLNVNEKLLKLSLTEDRADLIDLTLETKVTNTEGYGKLEVRSELFQALQENLHFSASYDLSKYKFSGKLSQHGVEIIIDGHASLDGEHKYVRVHLDGEYRMQFKIELHGMEKLESSLNFFGEEIYRSEITHSLQRTPQMTFHTIKLETSYKSSEPLVVTTKVGIGNKKVDIKVETPYDGWSKLRLAGELEMNDQKKALQIVVEKEMLKYALNALATSNKKESKYGIELQTPIEGYRELRAQVEYISKPHKEAKIHLGLESMNITVRGKFAPTSIEVELHTPFDRVRQATASVSWMLGGSNKNAVVKAQLNDEIYQAKGLWSIENKKGTTTVEVTGMNKSYAVNVEYDFSQEYRASATLDANGHQEKIGGRVALNRQEITIEAYTPIAGYEFLRGQVSYANKAPNHHAVAADWDLNGLVGKTNMDVKIQRNKIQINIETPIAGWDKISAEVEYQLQGLEKRLAMTGKLGEGTPFKLALGTKVTGMVLNLKQSATAVVHIDLELPLGELQKISLNGEYSRHQSTHSVKAGIDKNGEVISGHLEVKLPRGRTLDLEVKLKALAPVFGMNVAEASGKIVISSESRSTLLIETNLNGEKHKIEGAVQIDRHAIEVVAQTTFDVLNNLKFTLQRETAGKLRANLLLNDQESTLDCEYQFDGARNTKIDVVMATPIEGFRSIQSTVEIRLTAGTVFTALSYQNDLVRYGTRLEGTYERSATSVPSASNLKFTLMSPVYNFENVVTTFNYSFQNEPSIFLLMERNTREEISGEASWTNGEIKFNLMSKLPSYPINTRNSITWNTSPWGIAINVEAGPREYHAALNTNIRGFKFGDISLQSSFVEWNGLGLTWNLEGDIYAGKAVAKMNLGRFGEKSVRSSWRNDNWETAKIDLWYKENAGAKEKGFAVQYTAVGRKTGNGKFTALLTYSLGHKEQQLALTTAIKRTSDSVTLDVSFQTPYELVQEVSLHGKLISAQDTSLDLSASLNQQVQLTTHVIISVTPLASKLKLNFNAPALCEPFSLNAGYDFASTQKTLELAFLQNQYQISIGVETTVPRDSNEIELRMTVDSNVPLLEVSASGSIKAGYKIDSDGTRQLSVSVNSEQTGKWEVSGALRLATDFHSKLHITSPRQDLVPTIKFEVNNRGNLRQGISSDIVVRVGEVPEFRGSFSASIDKILIGFNSGIPGFENMSLEVKFESAEGYANKKFVVDVQAMGEHVALEGMVLIPGSSVRVDGSLELKSSWSKIQNGSLRLQIDESGNVEMVGVWGRKNFAVRGLLDGVEQQPWWRNINADLTLEMDSQKLYNIKSSHLIGDQVYSFNVTLGDTYNVNTYVHTGANKMLAASVQWDEDQLFEVLAEARLGHFSVSVNTPWTTPMHANGQYAVTEAEQSAKGYFTYDGQRSSLEARARTLPGSFESFVKVDIPILLQKLDAEVQIRRVDGNKIQGSIEMKMRDRKLVIQGEYTQNDLHVSGEHFLERNLKLDMSLPSQKYPQISSDITLQQPKHGFDSLHVQGSITMPSGVSQGAFGYKIPINNSNKMGVRTMIDTRYLSEHPIEVAITSGVDGLRKLELRVQYEKDDLQLSWDMTLPQYQVTAYFNVPELLPTHSPLRFEVHGEFDWPRNIQIKSTGSCSLYSYNVETSVLSSDNNVQVKLMADIPDILEERRDLNLRIDRNDNGQYNLDVTVSKGSKTLQLVGESTFQTENILVTGRISGYLGNHYAQFSGKKVGQNNWEAEMFAESYTLLRGKRVKVNAQLQPKGDGRGFILLTQCQTRGSTHTGEFTIVPDPWNGEVHVKLQSPRSEAFVADLEWEISGTVASGRLYTNAGGDDHVFEARLNKSDLEAVINMKCPMIPGEEFNVHTKGMMNDNQVHILANAKWNGAHWKLEGTFRYESVQDMEAKLEFRTPFDDWERITFAGKISPTEVHAEIYTPIKNFPNALIKLSGVPLFEPFTLEAYDNTQPLIIVGLPWVTYKVSGTFKLPQKGSQGDFSLTLEYGPSMKTELDTYTFSLQLPSLEDISWRMETPARIRFSLQFPRMGLLRWDLGGRIQWKTWAEINAYAELNGEKIELSSEIRNEEGNRRLSVILTTPFKNFEKFIASARLENYEEIGSGRSILVELQHPSWDESVRLEIDYRYRFNGFANMDGEISVVAPKFVVNFPPLSLRLQSNVKEGIYTGLVDGTWGEMHPSLKIQAGFNQYRIFATVEGMTSPNDIYAKAGVDLTRDEENMALLVDIQFMRNQLFKVEATLLQPSDSIDAKISLKTPFTILRSAAILVRLSPMGKKSSLTFAKLINNLDASFGAFYNGKKLVQLELISNKDRRSLEIYNPIKPVSIAVGFERIFGQKLRFLTEFCWDLRQAARSTIGFEFAISKTSSTSNGLFRVHAAEIGGVELAISHLLTSTKFDQGVRVKIFNPRSTDDAQELGYFISLSDTTVSGTKKFDFVTRIDTPSRSVQLQANQHVSDKLSYRYIELKWDITRDTDKKIGLKHLTEKITAWRTRTSTDTVTIIHPALPDSCTAVVKRTYKNLNFHELKFTFQPTLSEQDHVTFIASKENTNNGIRVLLTYPASKVNIQVQTQKTDAACAVEINYLDVHNEMQNGQITWSHDGSGKLLEIHAGQVLRSVFRVQLQEENEKTTFSLRTIDAQVDVEVFKTKPLIDLGISYDSSKYLYFTAGMPHKKEISMRLWRDEYEVNIQDALIAFRLNASQILSTKMSWRPELADEVSDGLLTAVRAVKANLLTAMAATKNKVIDELEGRWSMLHPSVKVTLKALAEYSQTELHDILQEFGRITKMFEDMYDQNWFFVKDISHLLGSVFEGIFESCVYVKDIVISVAKETFAITVKVASKLKQLFLQYAGKMEQTIVPMWNSLEGLVSKMYQDLKTAFVGYTATLQETYVIVMEALEGRVEELEKKILAIGFVHTAVRYYKSYSTWIEELPMSDYFEDILEFLKVKIWRPMEQYYQPYVDVLNTIVEEKSLLSVLEMPPFPYLRHVGNKIKTLCSRFWSFIEAEQKIKELVTKAIQAFDNLVRRNIPSSTVIWEVEKGQIEYHQPLTIFEWEDFTVAPTWKDSEQNTKEMSKMNDFYYEIMDTLHNAKPAMDMDIRSILPPFGAHAVMAGDYHYFTFDKKYFRFSGECSYVLVADLLHQNFSLIVNYENRDGDIRKKSYSLVSGNRSIEIDTSNLKVSLDGRKSELPLELGPTFIRRIPNSLEVFDTRGFRMTCSQTPAVCTISVSGWYFGKVGGLLGTYDNEQMNDMKTPDGQIVTDVSNFAHSWRVGKNSDECRMKNLARNRTDEAPDADGICSQHFDDRDSLLRPCFGKVDTALFKDMCLYDTSRNLNKASRQESACTAISAYVTECQNNGIDVWLPPTCVRCKLEDGTTLISGENATLEMQGDIMPPNSTDVVVLLEEASCLSDYALTETLRKLDIALQTNGLTENRYAVIGFAGQDRYKKPHIRTSSGQIWAHNTLFRFSDSIGFNGNGDGDLYEAIEFASRTLKFRAGVSKTFIAITCGAEDCGSENHYADTLTLLIENDIKLHMLTPKEFTTKGNKVDSTSSKIYGIDHDGVFTSAHVKSANMEADTTLKRQLNLPKDLCTPLAIETNGSRFHLQKNSKKSIDVWTRRVALTAQPSQCQHCECIPDKSGSPHVVCNRCISPLLEDLLREWQKYQSIDGVMQEEIPIEMMDY